MVLPLEQKVGWVAIASRVIVIVQLIICSCIPDHEADIFKPPLGASSNLTSTDLRVLNVLSGFLQWDSRYFHFVANNGYIYQNTLVFLPLFPLLLHLLSYTFLYPLHFILSSEIVSLIAGVVLNNVCFVLAARLFYRLSCRVVGDNTLAYKAALIFCFNPASVFFSVLYSESLFVLISLFGFLLFESGNSILSSLVLGLGTACRSNGLLNIIFVFQRTGARWIKSMTRILEMKSGERLKTFFLLLVTSTFFLIPSIIYLTSVIAPFLATQLYAYYLYCHYNETWIHPVMKQIFPKRSIPKVLITYGKQCNYQQIGKMACWCNRTFPVSYSAIQSSHWDVGFLKYYEIRQIPNFLLAAPVLITSLVGILAFARLYPFILKSLGMLDTYYERIVARRERMIVKRLTPYVIHLMAILGLFIFTIHIQVITRLLFSSSPCVYWILSYFLCERIFVYNDVNEMDVFKQIRRKQQSHSWRVESERQRIGNLLLDDVLKFRQLAYYRKFIVLYIIVFFMAGIYMHGNSLPWT